MKTGEFYSAGKLLLSGEYLVLFGAKALAIPLKLGQQMLIRNGKHPGIMSWKTRVRDKDWFYANFKLPGMAIQNTSDKNVASGISKILLAMAELSPGSFSESDSYQVDNHIEFDVNWGLGSSSSLISNLAWWMDIDPFKLFRAVFKGSGFDVMCARSHQPIVYQLVEDTPLVFPVHFNPTFRENLYFVYLGKKQDSEGSISNFSTDNLNMAKLVEETTSITEMMLESYSLDDFMSIMIKHEDLLSLVLEIPPVGKSRFPDFPGAVKSLGAWGGDFILAASPEPEEVVKQYFLTKGLEVFFRYHDLAL